MYDAHEQLVVAFGIDIDPDMICDDGRSLGHAAYDNHERHL